VGGGMYICGEELWRSKGSVGFVILQAAENLQVLAASMSLTTSPEAVATCCSSQ